MKDKRINHDEALAQRVALVVQRAGGQGRAAEIAGVSRTTIQEWRTGTLKVPLVQTARLARAADVSLEWLAFGDREVDAAGERADVWLVRKDVNSAGAVVEMPDVDWAQMPFRRDYLEHYGVVIEHSFVMVVVGDEALPAIHPTDVIIVDGSKRDLTASGLYAFVRFKRLMLLRTKMRLDGSVTLIADNESYGKEELSAEAVRKLDVVGRVMANLSAQTTLRT